MKKLHFTLILLSVLWNLIPTDSPFRPLFDRFQGDSGSGGATTQADPETDPIMINMPPPR
ncbi:MAG TPA: hypothetical protein VN493_06420 [Thermoanaerobaculia bacterium]|nr:hypothetical protein [Thermoanaerobaculia bacterium]